MTAELSRRLLALGVPRPELEAALFVSVVRGVAIARALVDRGVLTERVLEEDLARAQGFALEQVTSAEELTLRLPPSMCRRLGAIPIRLDAFANVAEVAAIDAQDPHVQAEFAFHLGLEVRVVRATMSAIEAEIRRIELGDATAAPARVRRRTPAFPHGAPKSSMPPPPMEEIPIPLVRRVGAPSRPGSSRPGRPPGSHRNPTPPQFSFGAAHVRAPLPAARFDESDDGPEGADDDLDPATIARTTSRVNGAAEGAPASVRHAPRLLGDGAAGAGPAVSFPSAPPSARRPSDRPVPLSDPALAAIAPQSLIPSTELAPPRVPEMAIPTASVGAFGPVSAHAVLEWGPASDAFARGLGSLSEPDPPDFDGEEGASAPEPLHTLPAAAPILAHDTHPDVFTADTVRGRADDASHVTEPVAPDFPERHVGDTNPVGTPIADARAAWDESTDVVSAPPDEEDTFLPGPHSHTRFFERSPEDVLPEALDTLSGALSRDELIAALIEVATMVAERVGVFVVKKDGFYGWACNEAFGDVAKLRTVCIPSKVPNILATATAAGFYLGPVPNTPGHRDLLAVIDRAGGEVSVNVATVSSRPVLVLVSDGFGDTLRTTKVLGEMMRVAGLTLARLLSLR